MGKKKQIKDHESVLIWKKDYIYDSWIFNFTHRTRKKSDHDKDTEPLSLSYLTS